MKTFLNHIISNKEKLFILFDQGMVSGVNFTIGILLARFLGLEEYGLFALAWMVVLFASSIHQAFIIMPMYTLYPKQENQQMYLSTLMGIQILFSIFTFCVIFLIVSIVLHFFPEWNRSFISFNLALISALFVLHDYLRRLFFTLHFPLTVLLIDVIGYGFQPILILLLTYFEILNITNVLLAINSALALSILIAFLIKYTQGVSFCKISNTLILNWKFSKFLIGTSLLQWVSGNLFIAMAGGILGPVAVGAIRIAQNIVGVLHVLFLAMENLVPVRAAELFNNKGRVSMLQYIGKITKQAALPTIGLLSLIIVFRNQIIELLYGTEYLQFQSILLAFCGLYVLVFIGTLLRFIIRTVENNRIIFISYVASTLLSLLFAKPLVEYFEVAGVLIGLFSVQILTLSIYLISLKPDLKWIFK